MLCNVTGTLYLPNGQLGKSLTLRFRRADQRVTAEYLGAVVPHDVYTQSDKSGQVDFDILTGVYVMHVEGGYSVRCIIPDAATADISDCIDAAAVPDQPPVWYQQALDARDEAVDAADMAADAASDAEQAAQDAADNSVVALDRADQAIAEAESAVATQARRDFGKWHLTDYLHPDDMAAALAGDTASQDESRVTAAIQQMNDDAMEWWRDGNARVVETILPPVRLAINDEYFSQSHASYVWDLPHGNNRWIIRADNTELFLKNWTGRTAVRTGGYYPAHGISYPTERVVLRWERFAQNGVFPRIEGFLTIRGQGDIDNDPVGVKLYNGAEIQLGKIYVASLRNHNLICEGLFNGSFDNLSLNFGGYQPTEFGGDHGLIPGEARFSNSGPVVTATQGIFTSDHVGRYFGLAESGPDTSGGRMSFWSIIQTVDSPNQITLQETPTADVTDAVGSFEAIRCSGTSGSATVVMSAAIESDMTGRIVTICRARSGGPWSLRGTLTTRILSHSGNTIEVETAPSVDIADELLIFSPLLLVDQIASSSGAGVTDNITFTAPRLECARLPNACSIPAVFGAYRTGAISDAKLHGPGSSTNNFGGSASGCVLGMSQVNYSGMITHSADCPKYGLIYATGREISANFSGHIEGSFGTETAIVCADPISANSSVDIRMGMPVMGGGFPSGNQTGVRLGDYATTGMVVNIASDPRAGNNSLFPTRFGMVTADSIETPKNRSNRIVVDGGSDSWSIVMPNSTSWVVTGQAICRQNGGPARKGFLFNCMIGRGVGASTVSMVGTPNVDVLGSSSAGSYDLAVSADTIAGGVGISLTGDGVWSIDVTISEARV